MKEGDRLRRALKIRNRILNVMRSEVVILVGHVIERATDFA